VRRIQYPQGEEARRSTSRFLAPGASAGRWYGLESQLVEQSMSTTITHCAIHAGASDIAAIAAPPGRGSLSPFQTHN